MGGVQVTVSWSTDGLVTVMFPTGPGVAGGREGRGGEGRGGEGRRGGGGEGRGGEGSIIHNQFHVQLTYYLQDIISHNSSSVTISTHNSGSIQSLNSRNGEDRCVAC